MKRVLALAAVAALVSLTAPTEASAQGVWFGAGATIPTGDFSDFGDGDGANTGWMASVGFGVPVGDQGLSIAGEGFFGSNNHDTDGDKTNLFGGMGHLVYNFTPPDQAGLFVFGGAGLLVHQYKPDVGDSENDTNLALNGGAGVDIPVGTVTAWGLGRFVTTVGGDGGNTSFIGLAVGLTIPVGGDGD